MTEGPDKVLLENILKKIEDSKLVTEKVFSRYRKSIAEGAMTVEDWCLLAEPLENDNEEIAICQGELKQ